VTDSADAGRALARLLQIMQRLRDPQGGCPWDRAQDFAGVAPYTIEEAYEVADAIARGTPKEIESELGDLLFQVVFHAQMGAERGWFDFASIADAICSKLTERHPHVFGDAAVGSAAEMNRTWEEHKARERAERAAQAPSELADVPLALPALARATKLGRRAARVGFDWADPRGVRAKIEEELQEVDSASSEARAGELGDLLFAVANWSRHLGVDAEEALRLANVKFERRFGAMEDLARQRSLQLAELDAAAWDALWNEVKGQEKTEESTFSRDSSAPA
jgi:ATP diphosphatase